MNTSKARENRKLKQPKDTDTDTASKPDKKGSDELPPIFRLL